jgi:1-acyl-sn-glycerol-3-phosphate acyltransferase
MPANLRRIAHLLYGGYAALAFVFIISVTLLLLAITPGQQRRRRLAKWAAGAVFWSTGSPIEIDGADKLEATAAVVVANHSSYLDGVILTAVLPVGFTFVIKKEMEHMPLAGWLLRRLGSEFVDRDNREQRTRAARRLLRAAEARDALVFFPEGTFDEQPGLKRFRPGAFRAAQRADVPLVPVAIRGARKKLPAGQWLPGPGQLSVTVTTALNSGDYPNAGALGKAARQAILAIIPEPDLEAN